MFLTTGFTSSHIEQKIDSRLEKKAHQYILHSMGNCLVLMDIMGLVLHLYFKPTVIGIVCDLTLGVWVFTTV